MRPAPAQLKVLKAGNEKDTVVISCDLALANPPSSGQNRRPEVGHHVSFVLVGSLVLRAHSFHVAGEKVSVPFGSGII